MIGQGSNQFQDKKLFSLNDSFVVWFVGWFCSMSNFVRLFYIKVILAIMVSNYMWSKNVSSVILESWTLRI